MLLTLQWCTDTHLTVCFSEIQGLTPRLDRVHESGTLFAMHGCVQHDPWTKTQAFQTSGGKKQGTAALGQARADASALIPLKGLSILVVEDDPSSAKLLTVLLSVEGATVKTAWSAEEAAEIVKVFKPQVIVLELVLPLMCGLLLAQRLKSDPETRDIVIVAVTAFNGPETERVTKNAGCAAYVRKPIDALSFTRTILQHVGGPIEHGK
jgi:CheY-like chemotaxis protein